jgi:hypothetical protein
VFTFGDAHFYGSLPGLGIRPAAPIVGIQATRDQGGYYLVGADGGVFSFGDAKFYGSLPAKHVTPTAPIAGMAMAPVSPTSGTTGTGYWLFGTDGNVYPFGQVASHGSLVAMGIHPAAPIVGMVPTPNGEGYWLLGADGGVFAFGSAKFYGSLPGIDVHPLAPISAAAGVGTTIIPAG